MSEEHFHSHLCEFGDNRSCLCVISNTPHEMIVYQSVTFSAHLIRLCQRDAGTEEIPDKESTSFHVKPPQRPTWFPQNSRNLYYHLATPFPHARGFFEIVKLIKIDFAVCMMCWTDLWCLPCGVKNVQVTVWCDVNITRSWRLAAVTIQTMSIYLSV